jgi:hypothetical protein
VSVLRKGDENLHYSDGSHRWIAPPDIDQHAWDAGMRAHLSLHLTTMGGPVEVDELRECRRPGVPRQRSAEPAAAPAVPARRARLVSSRPARAA